MNKLKTSIIAPRYALGNNISPANTNAAIPAATGSKVKMTPTWAAEVYCCATACITKANPVQKIAKKIEDAHTFGLCGKVGVSIRKERIKFPAPANPN